MYGCKKTSLFLMIIGSLFFSSIVYGAGSSFTVVSDETMHQNRDRRIITCLAVADDTNGSIPDLVLRSGTSGIKSTLEGWTFFKVKTFGKHDIVHDGSANAAVLHDTSGGFNLLSTLVGYTVTNSTDSSSCTITANTDSTITCTLAGGTDNDWDVGDTGLWGVEPTTNSEIYIFMDGDDILKGNGVNAVDADADNEITAYVGSTQAAITITNNLIVNITQQAAATNDAIIPIQIELYK